MVTATREGSIVGCTVGGAATAAHREPTTQQSKVKVEKMKEAEVKTERLGVKAEVEDEMNDNTTTTIQHRQGYNGNDVTTTSDKQYSDADEYNDDTARTTIGLQRYSNNITTTI